MFFGLSPYFLVSNRVGGLDQGILPNQKKWWTNSCLPNPESDKSELRISDVANDKTREKVETKQNSDHEKSEVRNSSFFLSTLYYDVKICSWLSIIA